jgi:pyruvate-formate lyase-activating enzyme
MKLIQLSREMPDLKKVIRVPLIPGYNDDVKTVAKIAEFVRTLDIQ